MLLEGRVLLIGEPDSNGLMITRKQAKKLIKEYRSRYMNNGVAYGHLEHEMGDEMRLNLNHVSHIVKLLEVKKRGVIGTFWVLDTPKGRIVKELYSQGGRMSASAHIVTVMSSRMKNSALIKCFDLTAVSADGDNWLEEIK